MAGLLESSSLLIFLAFIHLHEPQTMAAWLLPYSLASAAGVATTLYLWQKKAPINPIFFAIQCYFVSGFLALACNVIWLNHLYGQLRATAMLLWIFGIGLAFHLFSSAGFLGVKPDRSNGRYLTSPKIPSLLLLLVCALSLAMAHYWQGQQLAGELIPFFLLFGARSGLLRMAN